MFSFYSKIVESMNDHLGKSSATRINGYILTILISISVFVCLGIEIASAVTILKTGGNYSYTQLISLILILMGHHALLFQLKRKGEETSFPSLDKLNELNKKEKVD